MQYSITIAEREERKVKDTKTIPFGVQPTEHMFIAEYRDGKWMNTRIVPFQNLVMSPLALCLHYGQTVFEGMKAFYGKEGQVNIFRPDKHYERFCQSLDRMCMPLVPKGLFIEALHQLVQLDAEWVPKEDDGSLYLRPFMIASEERIGIKVSEEYLFMIVASPAYQYYTKPLKVKIETKFIRAAEGGTGSTKCGGNYGGALFPTELAHKEGYDQVLWTDAFNHEFIEESGTMNVMFIINGKLITAPLSGTILDGVTRDSLLTLAKNKGIVVEERPIRWSEIIDAISEGKKVEAFGAGTAAVVAPFESIGIEGKLYNCYIDEDASMYQLKKSLFEIRKGLAPDLFNWIYQI
jgi:branched-chain amino acid aminotransferase